MSIDEKIRLITKPITRVELKVIAAERFGDMVKAVVDIEKNIMAIGGELHADEEAYLIELGSLQGDMWGINIYPDSPPAQFIEFDSMINIRPRQGNRSRGVEDGHIQEKINKVVHSLVSDV